MADSFFSWLLIKTRIERIEVLSVKRVGYEPQGFAEMINLSKSPQSLCRCGFGDFYILAGISPDFAMIQVYTIMIERNLCQKSFSGLHFEMISKNFQLVVSDCGFKR